MAIVRRDLSPVHLNVWVLHSRTWKNREFKWTSTRNPCRSVKPTIFTAANICPNSDCNMYLELHSSAPLDE